MRHLSLRVFPVVLGSALVVIACAAASDEANWKILASMPREHRLALAERIREFDALPRAEQDAIRALDAKINEEPDDNADSNYAVLRRYHHWIGRLTDAQRTELRSASGEQRVKLVEKLVSEQRSNTSQKLPYFTIAEFSGASPITTAYQIKLWLAASDAEKEALQKLPEPERFRRLDHLVAELKPAPIKSPSRPTIESIYPRLTKSRLYPFMKKLEEAKKDEQVKDRIMDHYYFIENPPKKVSPERLLKFDEALPFWIRSGIDSLPPEEARRRLTILYRLVFNDGEMPDPKPKTANPAPNAPAPPPKPAAVGKTPAAPPQNTGSPF